MDNNIKRQMRFRDIGSRNVNDLDLTLTFRMGQCQIKICQNESLYMTSYLMAIVMFSFSDTISEIFAVELYMTLTLTFRTEQYQI